MSGAGRKLDTRDDTSAKRPRLSDDGSGMTSSRHEAANSGRKGSAAPAAVTAAPALEQPEGYLGRHGLVDRAQYIRLLEQAVRSLGFGEVADQLERASGIASQPRQVDELQAAILAGDWAAATKHIARLQLPSSHALQEAKFLILEQAFLEALQAGQAAAALALLREQLAPLGVNPARLHRLAACLMGGGRAVAQVLAFPGSGSDSDSESEEEEEEEEEPLERLQRRRDGAALDTAAQRHRVLRKLQAVIPPDLMLRERRLEELVEQALVAQIANCRFHNAPGVRPSLLSDYTCGTEQIPTCTTQVLLDHADEVWHLAFSHNGRMLASCGKDQTAIIWDVERRGAHSASSNGSPGSGGGSGAVGRAGSSSSGAGGQGSVVVRRHVLRGHSGPIAFLCWSPDDRKLATCGQDALRLWDAATGTCLAVFVHHTDPVTCAAWFPDGKSLVTGSHDKQLCVVDLDGVVKRQWRIQRIQEVLVAKGGRYILATTCERKVRVYDLETDTESYIPEGETLISMSLSRDGRYLLVNLTSNTMHLWDLGSGPDIRPPAMPCARFEGRSDKQSRFVVRSCLGGLDDRFVLTGSEECRVYVYHRRTGERLLELEGHSGTVNSVAWNPADPTMFASASDDKSIHIWQPAAVAAAAGVGGGLQ